MIFEVANINNNLCKYGDTIPKFIGIESSETADKAAYFTGCKSPAVNCPFRTDSISGTRGGNKPWYVRKQKSSLLHNETYIPHPKIVIAEQFILQLNQTYIKCKILLFL